MSNARLTNLIADNFLVYFKAHTYHLNVIGPNFDQYHGLFKEAYDLLWEWHDGLSEQLRMGGDMFKLTLMDICKTADIKDNAPGASVQAMFQSLSTDLDALLIEAEALYASSPPALETVIGDYCAAITKMKWKISATLGK